MRRYLRYLPYTALLLLPACSGDLGATDEGLADDSADTSGGSSGVPSGPGPATDDSAEPSEPTPGQPGSGTTGGSDPSDPSNVGQSNNPVTGGDGSTPGGTPSSQPGETPTVLDPSDPTLPFSDCDTPGPRLIRRLTSTQYDNTLTALVGEGYPEEVVFSDPAVLGFHVDADAPLVSDLSAELLMNYAERVASWTIENQIWKVASCTTHDEACHRQVLSEFGRRAFRQELTSAQTETYLQMFAAEPSFEAGMYVVLSTMLQSPYLLYRRELGEPDPQNPGQYRLTPYEIASELSYFLMDSPPDDQLLNVAAEGRLSSQEDIDQQVYGLLGRQEAKDALANFVHGWLEVDNLFKKAKDPALYELTDPMRQAMLDETRSFFADVFQSGGTIGDLYSADFTMVNQPLAELYGLGGVGGDTFTRVNLEGRRSTGILAHAAFLTEHSLPDNSSPVQRGVIVRERLLCQDLPPVPENLDTNLDTSSVFSSNRERYQQHSSDPTCAGCHTLIDPIGFAFERYDAFGRYREQESGTAIDASGELTGVLGGPVPLDGLQSLSDHLSTSDEARSCLIRYWSYYAYGREGWPEQECNHDAIRRESAADGYKLQSTLFAILHAPHFTRRVSD